MGWQGVLSILRALEVSGNVESNEARRRLIATHLREAMICE